MEHWDLGAGISSFSKEEKIGKITPFQNHAFSHHFRKSLPKLD